MAQRHNLSLVATPSREPLAVRLIRKWKLCLLDRNLGVVVRRPRNTPLPAFPPLLWHYLSNLLFTAIRGTLLTHPPTKNRWWSWKHATWNSVRRTSGCGRTCTRWKATTTSFAPTSAPTPRDLFPTPNLALPPSQVPTRTVVSERGGDCFLFLFLRFHFGSFSSFKRALLTRYTRTSTCSNTVHSSPASSVSQSADSSPASSPGDVTRATMASLVATPVPGEGTPVGSVMDDLRGLLSYMHGGNGTGSRTAPCGWLSQSDRGRGGGRKRSWSPVVGVIASLW